MRAHAERGRTVLVSSHLLAEVAQSVDDVVVISHGRLRGRGPLAEVLGGTGPGGLVAEVRALDPAALAAALARRGLRVERHGDTLLVPGASTEDVGRVAAEEQLVLTGLVARGRSLEQAFLELTGGEA
jgi:ABC-2 type transport system ATP-binding protein